MTEVFPARVGGPWHAVVGVARYDGSSWSALQDPDTLAHGPGNVAAVAVRGSCRPYVAGDFQVVEDDLVSRVGRMARADGLLVGGRFDVTGGVPSWGRALLRAP